MNGIFYGIGVGTGDPELLTVKAVRTLTALDVLIAPLSKEGRTSVAYQAAKPYLTERTEVVFRVFPMRLQKEGRDAAVNSASDEIAAWTSAGKQVGIVTLGDPMLYSTYIYLERRLAALQVLCRAIPGVTSFSAAAARAGFVLAEQGERVAIVPSVHENGGLDNLLQNVDTAVLMKASGDCAEVIDSLERSGMADRAVFVSRLDLDREMIEPDIRKMRGVKADYLSMILARKG